MILNRPMKNSTCLLISRSFGGRGPKVSVAASKLGLSQPRPFLAVQTCRFVSFT